MRPLFPDWDIGFFQARPNRFVVDCTLHHKTVRAYLPNPGRLQELLLPGRRLYLAKNPPLSGRKTAFTVVAVEREGSPVFLHTHLTNEVARHLIEAQKIPGLNGYSVVRPEVTMGRSRFDFLLEREETKMILEVKSCTLFGREIAMFPDAVTERGRRHIQELAELPRGGPAGGVLFVVHWPRARFFLPDYHTDPDFARTLYELRDRLFIRAMAVEWDRDLSMTESVHALKIPWEVVETEAHDRGSYLIILRLPKDCGIRVGSLGKLSFRKGYYLYVGSAKRNLEKRILRHRRKRKRLFWHIDYLREHAEFHTALPVRSRTPLECAMARKIKTIADGSVRNFGASDCSCPTHLLGFRDDPLKMPAFLDILQHFRIDRLEGLL